MTFLGGFQCSFQELSDLHLGDEKGHLEEAVVTVVSLFGDGYLVD